MRSLLLVTGLVPVLAAQAPPPSFAAPVRLQAGKKGLGENRMYPSPVLQDMNGDGLADIVVGDLRGRLTVALRERGEGFRFGAEADLLGRDGKALDFGNW